MELEQGLTQLHQGTLLLSSLLPSPHTPIAQAVPQNIRNPTLVHSAVKNEGRGLNQLKPSEIK